MNVILVIFDSLRKDCISSIGKPPWDKVKTPNLDKFIEESFMMDRCYPESLPTLQARKAIYTGKRTYPFIDGDIVLKGDFLGAPGWGPIPEDQSSISEIFQQNGYTTALISSVPHMFKPSKNFHRGFDEWVWIRGYEVDTYRSGPIPGDDEIYKWLPRELCSINKNYYEFMKKCLININDVKKEEDYSVARVMREGVRWLEQNKDIDKKFLIIESFAPHEPFFVPEHYSQMYFDGDGPQQVLSLYSETDNINPSIVIKTQANYSGLVTMCDRWFGYFMDSIRNLNMLDDTLIIVTSDHGHSVGDNNWIGKRGYPSSKEIMDIPLFIRHPDDGLGRNIKLDMMVQHTDIPAFIMDAAGVDKRLKKYSRMFFINHKTVEKKDWEAVDDLHGISFYKNLTGRKDTFRNHVTIGWGSAVTVIKDNWWLNIKVNGKGALLYNLQRDSLLESNVASENPEIINSLFDIALKDAGGSFPDYLIELADNELDAPGCSDLVARKTC